MAGTRTFSIIKPDATRRNLTGAVTKMLEEAGLRVVASKRIHMSREQAEGFYAVHAERPFFGELVEFMISGPVVVQVLEGENAMQRNRDIMGATNPANAEAGTIRKELAESIEANTVHGSDSDENAAIEFAYFFKPEEIVGYVLILSIFGDCHKWGGGLPQAGRRGFYPRAITPPSAAARLPPPHLHFVKMERICV